MSQTEEESTNEPTLNSLVDSSSVCDFRVTKKFNGVKFPLRYDLIIYFRMIFKDFLPAFS